MIKKHLETLRLMFIGFEDTSVIEKFKLANNGTKYLYDLNKWDEFENKNPRIFAGMYQFGVKRLYNILTYNYISEYILFRQN